MRIKLNLLAVLLTVSMYSQSIYKGLTYGMTKSEAKKEFLANKDQYTNIDTGNGFLYRTYKQNFVFTDGKLTCVPLTPKGAALGLGYDETVLYLEHTRKFFENLNYQTFIDAEYWNAPLNYEKSPSKWGLILYNEDKTKIIQMYPSSYSNSVTGGKKYLVIINVWHYNTWMNFYNKAQSINKEKAKNTGF